MADLRKLGKGLTSAVKKAQEQTAADAIGRAAESAGMKAPVTANKPLTDLQDFHTSLGDRIRQGAIEAQNMIESMPFKYNKGQRVFTDDSAKKNRAPYEILERTRYGNQPMRADHPTLGANMGQPIRDPDTGKVMRTPYEAGYRVRGEIGEMILPESAIKGDVGMARGGPIRMAPGGAIKGALSAIRAASKQADEAMEAKRLAMEAANPPIKASEAYGKYEGSYLKPIFYDRMKVDLAKNKKGGPGFSGIQLVDPNYAAAKAAAGVTDQKMATRIISRNTAQVPKGADVIFTPSVGGLEQHKSNSTMFGQFADIFANQRKNMSKEEVQALSDRASMITDNKGRLIFPNGIDLGARNFRNQVSTYNQRALLADIFAGRGVGGEKGRTVPVEELLQKNLDPNMAEAGTLDLGNRMFRLDGNVIDRPDLHTDYHKILTGEDLDVNYSATPIDEVFKDFIIAKELEKGRKITDMDYRQNDPTQLLSEKLLTELQKSGRKKGGPIRRRQGKARGGLSMASGGSIQDNLNKIQNYAVLDKNANKKPNELGGIILAGASWLAGDANTRLAKEAFGEDVTNTAIGGQKTSDVLNQLNVFQRDGGTFAPNTTVVLDIGANDIATGVDETIIRANLNEIVSRLGAEGVQVILSGQPEANSYEEAISSTNLQMDDLYREIAASNSNVTLVDAMSGMLNDKSLMDESGFHLNSEDAKLSYLNQFANAYKDTNEVNQGVVSVPQEVEAQRPINIPDSAEIAEEKGLEDSDVIPTDSALDDSDPAETDTAENDSEVARAIANINNIKQEAAELTPQQASTVPDYSRAYEALGGANAVNDLRNQFLGMGIEENTIANIFSNYYSDVPQPLGVGKINESYATELYARGGSIKKEVGMRAEPMMKFKAFATPEDAKQFQDYAVNAMRMAEGGGIKKLVFRDAKPMRRGGVQKMAGGGAPIVSPEEQMALPTESQKERADSIMQILANMAKDQASKEGSSLKKPRAATDLLNRGVIAPFAGIPVDMINMGLEGVDALRDLASGKRVDNRLASEQPFLGSEHLKKLMDQYGITSGEDRPMMETALSMASPTGVIKGGLGAARLAKQAPEALSTARGGLETMSADVQRPFRPATLTMEGVAPDLGQKGGDKFKDLVTNRMITGKDAPVSMGTMGGRKTEQTMGQGLYENFAGQMETNPMVGVTIPRAGNLATNKRLIADIGTAGQELGQEMVAAHKFTPLLFKNPKDATAMMIGGTEPLTKGQIQQISGLLPGMIVSHSPKANGMFVAPFEGDALDYKKAMQAASEILGKEAKIQFGKADSQKDIMFRGDYKEMKARPPSAESTEMRNRLKKAEERIVRGPSVSQSGRQSPPSTLTSTVR